MSLTPESAGWHPPPSRWRLERDVVHVWRVALEPHGLDLCTMAKCLAKEEHARAARFHFVRDRHRFVIRHGVLRSLLGRYVGVPPEKLRFSFNPYGKPQLAPETGGKELRFNFTSSGQLALIAVVAEREVGVDLERIQPDIDLTTVTQDFFSAQEIRVIDSLPGEHRAQAFFRCWVRKEAYVKALGEGLLHPLEQFTVSLAESQLINGWRLRELISIPGYAAAVAAAGMDWQVRHWMFVPSLLGERGLGADGKD